MFVVGTTHFVWHVIVLSESVLAHEDAKATSCHSPVHPCHPRHPRHPAISAVPAARRITQPSRPTAMEGGIVGGRHLGPKRLETKERETPVLFPVM